MKPYNIRATVISRGAVATELPKGVTEPDIAENMRRVYEGPIPAESFAQAVAFAYEPVGRGGRERDRVPIHTPGALSSQPSASRWHVQEATFS